MIRADERMKSNSRRVLQIFLVSVLLLISCDLSSFAAPRQIPTPIPGVINMIVAQTAAAAGTQTAVLIPPTLTPSVTPFPSQTPSITPTPTNTFVFVTPTILKFKTPTQSGGSGGGGGSSSGGGGGGGSGGGSSSVTWSCKLTAQAPTNGTTFKASSSFTTNWTVKNTSSITWLSTSVDVINTGGNLMGANSVYDTKTNVSVGGSTTISIPMTAPSSSGSYTSSWSLRVGKTLFCPMSVTISVQ